MTDRGMLYIRRCGVRETGNCVEISQRAKHVRKNKCLKNKMVIWLLLLLSVRRFVLVVLTGKRECEREREMQKHVPLHVHTHACAQAHGVEEMLSYTHTHTHTHTHSLTRKHAHSVEEMLSYTHW